MVQRYELWDLQRQARVDTQRQAVGSPDVFFASKESVVCFAPLEAPTNGIEADQASVGQIGRIHDVVVWVGLVKG